MVAIIESSPENNEVTYTFNKEGSVTKSSNNKAGLKHIQRSKSSIVGLFYEIFLPAGYPQTVTEDYAAYQIYDSLQAFCSTINGLLSTQAALKEAGVGDSTATALSALLSWTIKDGTGMVGSILFTWKFAKNLDYDAKTWRFMADIFNDLGMVFVLLSPMLNFDKRISLALLCIGTLFKSLCGVCGGATKGALTQHFAKSNNMADVSAKDGSQETIINLVSMIFGSWLISQLETKLYASKHLLELFGLSSQEQFKILMSWLLFALLTIGHLYANYQACRSVVLDTINAQRIEILLKNYIKSITASEQIYMVCSPKDVSKAESIIVWHFKPRRLVKIGVSVEKYIDNITLRDQLESNGFAIFPDKKSIHVVLEETFSDYLKLAYLLNLHNVCDDQDVARYSLHYDRFKEQLVKRGWNIKNLQISFRDEGYRVRAKHE
ncbi:hypothetical protein MP638_000850 [Amoeboaphelidium occidentale]|nr:hypothetical protein MP638_000850 [Amoeboaphelidium occidentale]